MAIIAGYGLFLLQHVLPKVHQRDRMLGISRMSMGWNIDNLRQHLDQLGVTYDTHLLEQIRQGGAYSGAEFFKLLGFEHYEDIDFDASEGATIVHDMNTPLPPQHSEQYDFVFENGTLEHIFDVCQAISNIAQTVKVGGLVSHGSPLDAFNHGFYNFSVNFFNDFYLANGFSEMEFYLIRYAANWHANQNVLVERFNYTHEEFYIDPQVYSSEHNKMYVACIARKVEHVSPRRIPVQAAYDRSKNLSSRLNSW